MIDRDEGGVVGGLGMGGLGMGGLGMGGLGMGKGFWANMGFEADIGVSLSSTAQLCCANTSSYYVRASLRDTFFQVNFQECCALRFTLWDSHAHQEFHSRARQITQCRASCLTAPCTAAPDRKPLENIRKT